MSESSTRILAKGENFSIGGTTAELSGITVMMTSVFATPTRLDVSALQLDDTHTVRSNHDFIFFNQSVSAHGAIRIFDTEHPGDLETDSRSVDSVEVTLTKLDDDVARVVIAASLDEEQAQTFEHAKQLTVTLVESESRSEMAVFDVSPEGGETAIIFGEFYRRGQDWKFRAVGQGYSDGLRGLATHHGVDVEGPQDDVVVESSASTDGAPVEQRGDEPDLGGAESVIAVSRQISVRRPARAPKLPEWSLTNSTNDDSEWDRARLFSVSGIGTGGERERRAVSALLSVMGGVKEFGRELTRRCGAPVGSIETFIEPEFEEDDATFRPDGLIRIRRGQRQWTALVEAKTGDNPLTSEQVERYVAIAKRQKFDAVITVSNQLPGGQDDLPVAIDKRKLRNLSVQHLSWDEVRSVAIQMSMYQRIEDTTQSWVLREFVRYLQHDQSKLHGFTDMGPLWVKVRDGVKNRTLHPTDKAATEVCHQFDQLVRHLGHDLSCLLGVDVTPVFPGRREDSTPRVQQLTDSGALFGTLRIPGATGPLVISLDLRLERATCSITVDASDAARPATRVKAIVKQLPDASPKLTIQSILAGRQTTPGRTAEISVLREKPETLSVDGDKPIRKFLVSQSGPLGGKGGAARGSVVNATGKLVAEFYRDVVQNLRAT